MKQLNLIWQTKNGDETTFEFEYISKILFNLFDQNIIFDNKTYNTILDNSVIIYSNNSSSAPEEFLNYLNKFKDQKLNFYLLQLSNESLGHDYSYYGLANHVFRSYYDSNIHIDNLTFVPLGFKSGFFSEKNENFEDKKYIFSFIGQPKSDRGDLLENIEKENSVFIHKTHGWNCSTSLTQDECREIYKQTKFIPCPMGWVHPDSFRLMESLECGSIPVLKNYNNLTYFTEVWGKSPIPVVNSWHELSDLAKLSDEEYKTLYNEVFDWYKEFKIKLSNNIYKKITNE